MLKDSNQVKTGTEIDDNNGDSELGPDNWEEGLFVCNGIDTYTVAANVKPYVFISKFEFYRQEPP